MARIVQEVLNGVRKYPQYCWYIRAVVSSPVVAELSQLGTGLFSHMHSVIRELLGKSLCAAGRAAPGVRRDRWAVHTWVLGSVQAWAAWDAAGAVAGLGLCRGCQGRRAVLRLPWEQGFPWGTAISAGRAPSRKGLDEPLPVTGVVLCYGLEFSFLNVRIKYELFPLQPWGSSPCWEELSQVLDGCWLCIFPALFSMTAVGFIHVHWGLVSVRAVKTKACQCLQGDHTWLVYVTVGGNAQLYEGFGRKAFR